VLIVNVYVVPIREIQLILINDGAANTHSRNKFKSKLKRASSRAGKMADQKDQGQTNK
jgi:hypothetical protein